MNARTLALMGFCVSASTSKATPRRILRRLEFSAYRSRLFRPQSATSLWPSSKHEKGRHELFVEGGRQSEGTGRRYVGGAINQFGKVLQRDRPEPGLLNEQGLLDVEGNIAILQDDQARAAATQAACRDRQREPDVHRGTPAQRRTRRLRTAMRALNSPCDCIIPHTLGAASEVT